MSNTYDTHDLAPIRVALGCEYDADPRRMTAAAWHIIEELHTVEGARGLMLRALGVMLLPDAMRRIDALRAAEDRTQDLESLIASIGKVLSPDLPPSRGRLLDLARDAAQAVLDGDRNEARWTRATETLASLRAGIDALRAAARLDEALTDGEVLEHAAAALERWRETAMPAPDDASMASILRSLPRVAGHTWSVTARGRVVRLRDAGRALVAELRRLDDSHQWSLTRAGDALAYTSALCSGYGPDFATLADAADAIVDDLESAPAPADLPPMVVGWREDGTGWSLVRVDGDDEATLLSIHDYNGGAAWRIVPASHHDGYACALPPLTLTTRAEADAVAITLIRAANPDRRVVVEGEVTP